MEICFRRGDGIQRASNARPYETAIHHPIRFNSVCSLDRIFFSSREI